MPSLCFSSRLLPTNLSRSGIQRCKQVLTGRMEASDSTGS